MNKDEKIKYFEYLLHKLLIWYKQESQKDNDITTIKALKLLFFVTAAKTTSKSTDLIDTVFNEFSAMPYGHVESDIYDWIKNKKGQLDYFNISDKGLEIKSSVKIEALIKDLDKDHQQKVDEAVDCLKSFNKKIIKYAAFDLVDLSHQWYSWRKNYKAAKDQGKNSLKIPIQDIKTESKIFTLSTF